MQVVDRTKDTSLRLQSIGRVTRVIDVIVDRNQIYVFYFTIFIVTQDVFLVRQRMSEKGLDITVIRWVVVVILFVFSIKRLIVVRNLGNTSRHIRWKRVHDLRLNIQLLPRKNNPEKKIVLITTVNSDFPANERHTNLKERHL